MHLANNRGDPVDPVPFLVVALGAVMIGFSYGPIYLMAFGFSVTEALLACGSVVAVAFGVAHHRLVWTARPDLRGEVPAPIRVKRLFYSVLIGVACLALLALPLFVSR
jgi:hypothetical protein